MNIFVLTVRVNNPLKHNQLNNQFNILVGVFLAEIDAKQYIRRATENGIYSVDEGYEFFVLSEYMLGSIEPIKFSLRMYDLETGLCIDGADAPYIIQIKDVDEYFETYSDFEKEHVYNFAYEAQAALEKLINLEDEYYSWRIIDAKGNVLKSYTHKHKKKNY